MNPIVSRQLLEALEIVKVDPGKTDAVVGDRRIETSSPRELRRRLSDVLYEVLHAGKEIEEESVPLHIRDREFEKHLGEAVPHEETVLRGKICGPVQERDGEVCLVQLNGVRVWVPTERLRGAGEYAVDAPVGVVNDVRRPALSPGFFMVDGSRPYVSEDVLRVYVHIVDWSAAGMIWNRALSYLEEREVAYRSKVLSSKILFPRRDALVVYLDKRDRGVARGLAAAVGALPGVGAETSVFTFPLGPGVAMAWEPADSAPGMNELSFGQHRASVVAHALVESADGTMSLAEHLATKLTLANIDPANPARNLDSLEFASE